MSGAVIMPDALIVAHLRSKGMLGAIDKPFIREYRIHLSLGAVIRALIELGARPGKPFTEEMLAAVPGLARERLREEVAAW